MIYYELTVKYYKEERLLDPEFNDEESVTEMLEQQIVAFNEKIYSISGKNSRFIYDFDDSKIRIAIIVEDGSSNVEDDAKMIVSSISRMKCVSNADKDTLKEITSLAMKEICRSAAESGLVHFYRNRGYKRREWEYLESFAYVIEEEVVNPDEITLQKAGELLDGLMADKTLREEISRIFDRKNIKEFFGFPVHYRIYARNSDAARDMVRVIIRALHSRKRIPGTRLTIISDIKTTCDDRELNVLLKNSGGTAVMVELQGDTDNDSFASDKIRIARMMSDAIVKYSGDTLFFFFETMESSGFADEAISRLEDEIDMIDLKEGRGNIKEAKAYMERLICESRYAKLMDETAYNYLKKKKCFHASDVMEAVDEWSRMCLKEKAYSAYSTCIRKKQRKKIQEKKDAYDELQKMVGLEQVKTLVDNILDYYRINKEREKLIKKNDTISRHMIFTGNPGSAKTTVARLLAEILMEEGILTTGKIVECGRADLVGRYVGWTAKAVQAKFMQAKGGILFIDEAYSLVDASRSFGDEAINTIVQEMENMRDDVIVIFAGYPEPMKAFIEKNDGLMSRIAFHVEFPDYNEEELLKILCLMVEERGYKMNSACEERCLDIFRKAKNRENFGNGRFARNLLEHAELKQAGRIAKRRGRKDYSLETLFNLMPEDFEDYGMLNDISKGNVSIGFVINE